VNTTRSAYGVGAIIYMGGDYPQTSKLAKPRFHRAYYSMPHVYQLNRNYESKNEPLAVVQALNTLGAITLEAPASLPEVTDHANLGIRNEPETLIDAGKMERWVSSRLLVQN